MASSKTYNQVIRYLEIFAEAHKFIKSWGNGFNPDLNDFIQNNNDLPCLFFEVQQIPLNSNTQDYVFRIYSLDIKQKDNSNSRDVLSDTAQHLIDLRKWLINNFQNSEIWTVQFNSDILIPYNNYTNDYLVGWSMDVTISSALIEDDCNMPLNQIDWPSIEPIEYDFITCETLPSCPTIITINETLVDLQYQIDNIPGLDCDDVAACPVIIGLQEAIDNLATVATTGDYNDLINTPTQMFITGTGVNSIRAYNVADININGTYAFVVGENNTANAGNSTAVGGLGNVVSGGQAIAAGGQGNSVGQVYGATLGGNFNNSNGYASAIVGGSYNIISNLGGSRSFIGGCADVTITGNYSAAVALLGPVTCADDYTLNTTNIKIHGNFVQSVDGNSQLDFGNGGGYIAMTSDGQAYLEPYFYLTNDAIFGSTLGILGYEDFRIGIGDPGLFIDNYIWGSTFSIDLNHDTLINMTTPQLTITADVDVTGTVNITGNTNITGELKIDSLEYFVAYTESTSDTTYTIDCSNGNYQVITFSANSVIDFTNAKIGVYNFVFVASGVIALSLATSAGWYTPAGIQLGFDNEVILLQCVYDGTRMIASTYENLAEII